MFGIYSEPVESWQVRMERRLHARSIRDIPYAAYGKTKLCLDIHLPSEGDGPFPIVFWASGGGWARSTKICLCYVAHLPAAGFAVVAVDYRDTHPKRGRCIAPANILDCTAAVGWVHTNAKKYNLDPKRTAFGGSSAGGHLAAMVGAKGKTHAVIDISGVANLACLANSAYRKKDQDFRLYTVAAQYLGGGPIKRHLDLAKEASPIFYVSPQYPPTLILHGTRDLCVPVEQAIDFHRALKAVDADVEMHLLNAEHEWDAEVTDDVILRFLQRVLV